MARHWNLHAWRPSSWTLCWPFCDHLFPLGGHRGYLIRSLVLRDVVNHACTWFRIHVHLCRWVSCPHHCIGLSDIILLFLSSLALGGKNIGMVSTFHLLWRSSNFQSMLLSSLVGATWFSTSWLSRPLSSLGVRKWSNSSTWSLTTMHRDWLYKHQ